MTAPAVDDRPLYRAALRGAAPAERLTPNDRGVLVAELVRRGMTDVQIAEHTRWTTYTATRVRESRGIPQNDTRRVA